MTDTHGIHPDLQPLAKPIAELAPLPGNPRRGDVEAVARSYARFGQRKPVVITRDGVVIAGNHQLAAAKKLGWTHIACTVVDDDDTTAKAFALADNRTADLGTYDIDDLLAMTSAVAEIDAGLLLDAGYTADAIDALTNEANNEEPDTNTDPKNLGETYEVIITCESETHQVELLNRFLDEGLNVRGTLI